MAILKHQAASELGGGVRTLASRLFPSRLLLLLFAAMAWSSPPALAGTPVRFQGSTTFNSLLLEHHHASIERRAGLTTLRDPNEAVRCLIDAARLVAVEHLI
jgi:hypothetical protein